MTPLAVEAWHLLVAGAGGVGAVLLPLLRIRTLLREASAERAAEAVRREKIDSRLTALERFRSDHTDNCTREHDAIRDAVRSLGTDLASRLETMSGESARERATMHGRITEIATTAAEIRGTLGVMLQDRGQPA